MALVIFGLIIHPFLFAGILKAFYFTKKNQNKGCLSDILRTKHLKNVVQAIWNPRYEILLTLTLLILLIYYFTLISFMVFYKDYQGNC